MDVEKEREGEGGSGGEENKVSWPGSAGDFSLCGSHTLTGAGSLLSSRSRPVHPFPPAAGGDHTNTERSHDLIGGRWRRGRGFRFPSWGALGQYSGCAGVAVEVGLGERPLFAWVNALRRTGWVTAGVFNPKNSSLLNTITNFSVHCSH